MKFGPGHPVEIAVAADSRKATLTVRDHGIGIAPENHLKIFGSFERVVSIQNYPGLGLGLYISHQIVEAHGGKIRVESAFGLGATFIVELPFSELGTQV